MIFIDFVTTIVMTIAIVETIKTVTHPASSSAPQVAFFGPSSSVIIPRRNVWGRYGAFYNRTPGPNLLGCQIKASVIYNEQQEGLNKNSDPLEQPPDHDDPSFWKPICYTEDSISSTNTIGNLLICGDGDLSYSASISQTLSQYDIQLTATVLEEEAVHQDVYEHSKLNKNLIQKAGHEVRYGIDATKLDLHFQSGVTTFDRIQFNFPHWKGKANHKYNRELLNDFLKSASEFLSPNGEIHIALCQGQGGSAATTLEEWKDSWTPSIFAGEHGLLLFNVSAYKVCWLFHSVLEKSKD